MNLFGENTKTYLLTTKHIDYAVKVEAKDEWEMMKTWDAIGFPASGVFYSNPKNPKVKGKRLLTTEEYREMK